MNGICCIFYPRFLFIFFFFLFSFPRLSPITIRTNFFTDNDDNDDVASLMTRKRSFCPCIIKFHRNALQSRDIRLKQSIYPFPSPMLQKLFENSSYSLISIRKNVIKRFVSHYLNTFLFSFVFLPSNNPYIYIFIL